MTDPTEVRAEDSFKPSDGMVTEANRGLEWRREFGRGGTAIGIARARDISNRKDLPIDTWKRIKAYFDRHEVDKQGQGWDRGTDGYPSNGRIAWALWGGDPGWSRAKEIVSNLDDERSVMDNKEHRSIEGIYAITPVQIKLYEELEDIVELFGKFDKGISDRGAHYIEPDANVFAVEGIKCSNCVFYEGPRACELVDGDIDPNAACKFWIVPNELVEVQDVEIDPEMDREYPEDQEEDPEEPGTASIRYGVMEAESRRINGRDVEFRTVEVGTLSLRALDGENGSMPMRFAGYAAVFNAPSEPLPFRETIAPGAFNRSLKSGREIRMFMNHNTDQVLASTKSGTLSLTEDSNGLYVEADLPDTSYGRDLSVLMQRGDVHSMSFGFSLPRNGDVWSSDGTNRELREIILHEVSVVSGFPAYPATEGASVRSADESSSEEQAPDQSELVKRKLELLSKKR